MLSQARPDISRRFENINLKFDCSTGFEGCFGVYFVTPMTGSLLGPKRLTLTDGRLRPMTGWAGILIALLYFLLQYSAIKTADRQTETKSNLSRPFLYSLSVAASGSTWLYYGSTGYAAKYGVEFIGLYIGIVLVFTLGFPLLLRIVELARSEGIASISDFIGARYGKSFSVAAIVTLITTFAADDGDSLPV
jgi:hypothetical protein